MTALAGLALFRPAARPAEGNDESLDDRISAARAVDLTHPYASTRSLDIDRAAVNAASQSRSTTGVSKGVSNKTQLTMRQMYRRARFELLRHRIVLG